MRLFARVSETMKARGASAPVLVGGAAVELYTASAIATGDFDIVTGRQNIFEQALRDHGFVRPSGAGQSTRGWIHEGLRLGFEVVSGQLLDGHADRDRVRLIDLGADGRVAVIAVEDIIADRMGQYASGTAPEMLGQARSLYHLHCDADLDYMERRIREESAGDYGIADLEG
ncbi:hypothetical protein KC8_08505 [Sphingomonas sp. KC8]|nr:hypothetical protein KC8_08505 [Sphingomonas sp. KC8]